MPGRWLTAILFSILALSCTPDRFDARKKLASRDGGARSKLPPGFKLDLPRARIVVHKPDVPMRFSDGSYSVYGLLRRKRQILGKDVDLSAYVVEMHAPRKPKCPPCTPPHFYVADKAQPAEGEPRLLVADVTRKQIRKDKLKIGTRFHFTGTYMGTSHSGFSRTEGLLSFKGIKPPQ